MHARQAQTLQQHALNALGELRSHLGACAAELAPVAGMSQAGRAQRRAAYAAWGAQVDAALRAIGKAFPECERRLLAQQAAALGGAEPDVDSAPPTLRSPGAERTSNWIGPPSSLALLSPLSQPPSSTYG